MTCGNASMQTVNPDFVEVISDIESLLEDHIGDTIWCGDWNADLSRNTAQINHLKDFIERSNLSICWDHDNAVQDDNLIYLIIIDKYGDKLITSDSQFAFNCKHSTIMCTAVLKEVASYYNSRKSDVCLCMLDASKAFDRVNYGKLFTLLRSIKLPALVIWLLLDMYTR